MPKATKKKKKKKGEGPMPSGGAGLIRFFEDETPGVKVGPTVVVFFAAMLVIAVVITHLLNQFPIT
jgi:preprotein translocase subunit Sec61beta